MPSTALRSTPLFRPAKDGQATRLERHQVAIGVHAARELRVGRGSIEVMLHVVFARPSELHGRARGFSDLDRLADEVGSAASPEAASEEHGVDLDLFERKLSNLGPGLLSCALDLPVNPQSPPTAAHAPPAI